MPDRQDLAARVSRPTKTLHVDMIARKIIVRREVWKQLLACVEDLKKHGVTTTSCDLAGLFLTEAIDREHGNAPRPENTKGKR